MKYQESGLLENNPVTAGLVRNPEGSGAAMPEHAGRNANRSEGACQLVPLTPFPWLCYP
jgi:hypothetical protein